MSVHFHLFKFSVFSSIKQLLFTPLFDGPFVGLVALKNLIDWAVEDLPGFLLVFWCELFLNFAFPGLAQTLKPLFTMPVQSFCRLLRLLVLTLHVSLSPTCQNFKTVFFFSPLVLQELPYVSQIVLSASETFSWSFIWVVIWHIIIRPSTDNCYYALKLHHVWFQSSPILTPSFHWYFL